MFCVVTPCPASGCPELGQLSWPGRGAPSEDVLVQHCLVLRSFLPYSGVLQRIGLIGLFASRHLFSAPCNVESCSVQHGCASGCPTVLMRPDAILQGPLSSASHSRAEFSSAGYGSALGCPVRQDGMPSRLLLGSAEFSSVQRRSVTPGTGLPAVHMRQVPISVPCPVSLSNASPCSVFHRAARRSVGLIGGCHLEDLGNRVLFLLFVDDI